MREFTIKPRRQNDGVTLASEALAFPMWYENVALAVNYAKFRAGNQSARIEVFDGFGVIVEIIEHDPGPDSEDTLGEV